MGALFNDAALAREYWKDREIKVYAVDIVVYERNERKVVHTMYVRARDTEGAKETARLNDVFSRAKKPYYRARLAGPMELGCTCVSSPAPD
jgi:hypothetical protein